MTDNKDRFVTSVPNCDDISPGGTECDEVFSAEAEEFSENVADIPATPEWEKAFAAYAKEQAPDLMPRILEKIQGNTNTENTIEKAAGERQNGSIQNIPVIGERNLTDGSAAEPAKVKRKVNLFRVITSVSSVAAAVIIIGILIVLNNRLPKKNNTADSDSQFAFDEITPTGVSDQIDSDNPRESREKREPGNQASVPDDGPSENVPTPTRDPDEVDGLEDELRTDEAGRDTPREGSVEEANLRLLEERLKSQSLVYNGEGKPTLCNASVGETVSLSDGSAAYHLYIDGTDTGCLILWPEAEPWRTYSRITFSFAGTQNIGDVKYQLYKIIEWDE